ncbi:MAG: alkaline phosphatase family protein [Gammaproteobacteria bacterium]|nr:alkaline phosphatase family protein [Gammaproteobacteria bacterium]
MIDGLPFELIEGACRHAPADFPHLHALYACGRIGPLAPLKPNCQTPPSLFTKWSGVDAGSLCPTGYEVPDLAAGDVLGVANGFDNYPRHVPMIWDRYAERGGTVGLVGIPFVQTQRLGARLLKRVDLFAPRTCDAFVLEQGTKRTIADTEVEFDFDGRLAVRSTHGARATRSFSVRSNRLQQIDIDVGASMPLCTALVDHGDRRCLCIGGLTRLGGGDASYPRWLRGLGFETLYRRGCLGQKCATHGNSTVGASRAERTFIDGLELMQRDIARALYGLIATDAGLVVGYTHFFDLALHELYGLVTAGDGAVAREAHKRLLSIVDSFVGELAALCAPDQRLVVSSDHGMLPVTRVFRPNVLLRGLGLLSVTPDFRIDPSSSTAFYHPCESGLLCVRDPAAAAHVARVCNEYLVQRDLAPLELLIAESRNQLPGFAASCYVKGPPGCRAKADTVGDLFSSSAKTGDHTVYSDDPSLAGVVLEVRRGSAPAAPLPSRLDQMASFVVPGIGME